MSRIVVLVGLIVLGVATGAGASWIFGRTVVVHTSALVTQENVFAPRFQVTYMVDRNNPATCVMVIRDTETEYFSATAVDAGSCR